MVLMSSLPAAYVFQTRGPASEKTPLPPTVEVNPSVNCFWDNTVVCLSVCLSVCNAVHCGVQGRCRGLIDSCTVVFLARHFLFTSSDRQQHATQKTRQAHLRAHSIPPKNLNPVSDLVVFCILCTETKTGFTKPSEPSPKMVSL